ncbi:MAG: hypothetical protein JHC33_11330 [Ignisphaera sp.]|nr:hypothetical protein [Ignisphaera sp.]
MGDAIGKAIAIMFLSRDVAHRRHLGAKTLEEHLALNGFYDGIVELADKLAEAWQGYGKLIDDIPYMTNDRDGSSEDILRRHLAMLMKIKGTDDKWEGAIESIFDEIEVFYLSTLYKLRFLK